MWTPTQSSLLGPTLFAVGVVAVTVVVVACGSNPKPDAGTPTSAAGPSASGSPVPVGKLTPEQCKALVSDAQDTMDAEQIAVDKECKKDADCMPVKGRACGFVCANAAIPKIEERDWNESLTKVMNGPCKKWKDADCATVDPKPAPTCQQGKVPRCESGHCSMK